MMGAKALLPMLEVVHFASIIVRYMVTGAVSEIARIALSLVLRLVLSIKESGSTTRIHIAVQILLEFDA